MEHDVEVDVHLLELRGVGSLQVVVLLRGEAGEPEGPDLELEVGRFGVAAVVEGYYFAGVGGLFIDRLHQVKALQLPRPRILPLIGVVQFNLVCFVVVFVQQLYFLCDEVYLGRVALLHYYFDDVFALEAVDSEDGDVVDFDLGGGGGTYWRLLRSTLGKIFSISCLRVSLKLSLSFLSRKRPWTVEVAGSTPRKRVPPLALRKEMMDLVTLHLTGSSLKGME